MEEILFGARLESESGVSSPDSSASKTDVGKVTTLVRFEMFDLEKDTKQNVDKTKSQAKPKDVEASSNKISEPASSSKTSRSSSKSSVKFVDDRQNAKPKKSRACAVS